MSVYVCVTYMYTSHRTQNMCGQKTTSDAAPWLSPCLTQGLSCFVAVWKQAS